MELMFLLCAGDDFNNRASYSLSLFFCKVSMQSEHACVLFLPGTHTKLVKEDNSLLPVRTAPLLQIALQVVSCSAYSRRIHKQ